MPDKVYRTAIYCRLSREDGDKVESNSIASQRAICEDYIARHEDLELVCEPFVDDGYSGVSFNRPQFKKLEEAIRKGALDCIVVKDLSRFSRNYIDGGRYIEKIFPQLGIRFIAINDAYDSLTGDPQSDSFVIPFKNLINDSYCKDISMKIRSSLEVKQKSGEFVGSFAPYGYMKSPENKNQLIVDEAVSEYVQMIFSMYKDGFSIGRIAKRLNQMGVLSPMEYKHSAGVKFDTVFKTGDTAKWTYKAVQRILTNEVYIGVLAQGKRGTPNYKVRVVKSKDESEWVHKAISNLKAFLQGTYHGRCTKLQAYLDEYCFRFNRRMTGNQIFLRLTRAVATCTNSTGNPAAMPRPVVSRTKCCGRQWKAGHSFDCPPNIGMELYYSLKRKSRNFLC